MEAVVVKRQVCWRDILSLLGLFFMILQREKIYGQTFNHLRSQASRIGRRENLDPRAPRGPQLLACSSVHTSC